MTLAERYDKLVSTPSSINEHLPTLRGYAARCESIAEFGVDIGQSTTAFLMAQPKLLISLDVVRKPELDELFSMASIVNKYGLNSHRGDDPTTFQSKIGETVWWFYLEDSRRCIVSPVDMLLIDSAHCYDVIKVELERHASNVRRWIICHDTVTFGKWGEAGEPQVGIGPALDEFLAAHPEWFVQAVWDHNNGLTVLERMG